MSAEEYKTKGNQAFSAKEYEKAIEFFSKAIDVDPSNHVLYSNRSASYSSLKQYDKALEDANKTVELKSDWAKGYSRKGAALHGLGKLKEARETYEEGLKVDPNNAQLKKALEEIERADSSQFKIFGDDALVRIAMNPKLRSYLDQPDFVEKIKAIQADPNQLQLHMQDNRVKEALMFLLTGAMNFPQEPQEPKETEKPTVPEPKTRDIPEPEPEPTEKSEDDLKKEEAIKEKNLGNEAYKKREFEKALQHYDKAWELDSTNASILTNKAGELSFTFII
ncbi:stress-inducible protein [Gigaspora margarita]|uniref:Stress-inducible protein n=1 Tax=Gigaspora margarita TaxID=4874 RepID=A0A8H3ZXM4_GIGMA|nr:stress-inducible protein [Gigaspora margarita]